MSAFRVVGATPLLTEQAGDLDGLWRIEVAIALGVGVLVAVLLGWVVVRYRRRERLPSQRQYHVPLEIGYTLVPLAAVGLLFALTLGTLDRVDLDGRDADVVVQVTGFQWQWQFDYPAASARSVGTAGTNARLVLPAGERVRFELTSSDVVHSFWVPGFRTKRDLFPGQTTVLTVDVGTVLGHYPDAGVSAEFCGLDHHKMRFDVWIVSPSEFRTWLARNPVAAEP